ncbi:hypothetical protein M1N13_02680 [Dehalococcoidia bacterium]|nr:hypothetical protein [Dehalococcoidia bacterium]
MIPPWLEIAGVVAVIIGTGLGVIGFVRTIYINKRLNDEPYFKNILGIVEKTLSREINEAAQYSATINERINKDISDIFASGLYFVPEFPRDKLESIKYFLGEYTLKYDRKFQKSVLQIYDNSVKLQNTIENFNQLIYPTTTHAFMKVYLRKLNEKEVESMRKIIIKYLGKKSTGPAVEDSEEETEKILQEYFRKDGPKVTIKEFAEALKESKRYMEDIRKIRGKMLTLTNSIKKDADRFNEKLRFYLLKFGSSPNTV